MRGRQSDVVSMACSGILCVVTTAPSCVKPTVGVLVEDLTGASRFLVQW